MRGYEDKSDLEISSKDPFREAGNVLALWHDEKSKNVHYAVVRLHDLDEARLTRIEAELAEIKQLLKEKKNADIG